MIFVVVDCSRGSSGKETGGKSIRRQMGGLGGAYPWIGGLGGAHPQMGVDIGATHPPLTQEGNGGSETRFEVESGVSQGQQFFAIFVEGPYTLLQESHCRGGMS